MTEVTSVLMQELQNHSPGWAILFETRNESVLDVGIDAIKFLTDENYNVLVLSASRPYPNLIRLYKKKNIDTKRIFVLDCISNTHGTKLEENSNVRYLQSPSDLTRIAIQMTELFKKITGKNVLFIDSITTLLIHNKPGTFVRFIHHILTKMRINDISTLLISVETEANAEVTTEIAQLCDAIIKV